MRQRDWLLTQADRFRDLAEQLRDSPAMRAVEQLRDSPAMRAVEQLRDSPAMRAVEQLRDSPAMRAVEQLRDSPAMRAVEQLRDSPAMRAVEQLRDSPAMRAVEQLRDSPAMRAVEQLRDSPAMRAVEQLRDSPAMRAVEQLRDSPAMRAVEQLRTMPPLPSQLFGAAWDERLDAAVSRLERAPDIIAEAPEPEQAAAELATDAELVRDAASPEAREGVNTWTQLFWLWLLEKLFVDPAIDAAREAALPVLIAALLVVIQPPDPPPAPDLPTTQEFAPATTALQVPSDWAVGGLPAIVQRAGPTAIERVVEFFSAEIANPSTRTAYANAVARFFNWCDNRGLSLDQVSRATIADYVEELQSTYRGSTAKQHLAAIRRLFDWLVIGQVVPSNPAATVRGATSVMAPGKTPILQPAGVRLLFDSVDTSSIGGLRDRALLGVMIYSFARVSAIVSMDVDDYYQQGERRRLRLRVEGENHELPVHHEAEAYLNAYLEVARLAVGPSSPLWRSLTRTRELSERRMSRVDVLRMIKRRSKTSALGDAVSCRTLRASGITAYLLAGGTLERAQAIAGHASIRTTQLYDRTAVAVTVEDIERIRI